MAIRVDWLEDAQNRREAQGNLVRREIHPSVPYVVNLLMDPMEKMTPRFEEFGYAGRKFVAQKLWAPTAATPFLAAHLNESCGVPTQPRC